MSLVESGINWYTLNTVPQGSLLFFSPVFFFFSSSDVDKWKHPVGINWIWEQSPAGSTRTDKHPRLYPHLPPSHWHTQTGTHLLILLYSSHALEKCLTPLQTHIFYHPDGSASHTHTYTQTCARTQPLPISWIHCFHGSHVFCTCRMRQTGLSEGKETTPINSLACYWLTACSCTPISRERAHAHTHRVSTFLLGSPERSAVECDNKGSSVIWRAFTSRKGGDSISAPNTYLCLPQLRFCRALCQTTTTHTHTIHFSVPADFISFLEEKK